MKFTNPGRYKRYNLGNRGLPKAEGIFCPSWIRTLLNGVNLARFVIFFSELSEVLSSVSTGTSVKANLSRAKGKSVAGVSSMRHSLRSRGLLPHSWQPSYSQSLINGFWGYSHRWSWSLELTQSCTCGWTGCFVPKHSKCRICPAVFYSVSLVLLQTGARCEILILHFSHPSVAVEMGWNVTNQHSHAIKALTEMMDWEKSMEIICRDKPVWEKIGNFVSQSVARWCDKYSQPWRVISGVSLQDDSSWCSGTKKKPNP